MTAAQKLLLLETIKAYATLSRNSDANCMRMDEFGDVRAELRVRRLSRLRRSSTKRLYIQ